MGTSIKRNRKSITPHAIFIRIAFSFLSVPAALANTLPAARDINDLAEMTNLTTHTFMQESFELRMKYEYYAEFPTQDDKENLYKLAKRTGNRLAEIVEQQRKLKQLIEDYQGNDWDSRYGSTGLWRKLSTDLYKTCMSKCQINFYLALASQQQHREEILHKILSEIDLLNRNYKRPGPKLIKAKVLVLLAQTDAIYTPLAIKELDAFAIYSDITTPISAVIEKIKLVGSARPNELNIWIRNLTQNRFNGDLELIFPLVFLQRQHDPNGLEKTIGFFPETEDFFGSLILSDLSNQFKQGQLTKESLEQVSIMEVELAAQAAWTSKAEDYRALLDYLSNTRKFQTPLIFYIVAATFADSSPSKAVNLLIKASKSQQLKKSPRLNIEPHKIAAYAAKLAYNQYATAPDSNKQQSQLALEAFENYSSITDEKMDEELEYLYTIILNDSGQAEKSKLLLEKIADRPAGNWRNRAKLILIRQQLQQTSLDSQSQRNKLLKQLSDLIANCDRQDENHKQIRTEAISIYCQLLLERQDKASAKKVLNILSEAETAHNPNLNFFKSVALRHLNRLDESAERLLKVCNSDNQQYAIEAMELLAEIIDKIDKLQTTTENFPKFIKNCQSMAEYCQTIALSTDGLVPLRQARLYLAEISVFAALKKQEKLLEVDKLIKNMAKDAEYHKPDLLRCSARLLTEQGKYEDAAKLWAQICEIRKNESTSEKNRTWKWWRAKFYELACWAKIQQTQKQDVLHTIEVLENSFQNVPAMWAEKLNSLKQQYHNQPASIHK